MKEKLNVLPLKTLTVNHFNSTSCDPFCDPQYYREKKEKCKEGDKNR